MNTRNCNIMVLGIVAGLALGASVNAAVIFTEDFESVAIADGAFTSTWPTPTWTTSSGTVSNVLDPATTGPSANWLNPVPAELGEQFATLHSGGTATADLTAVYQANSVYTLTFTHFKRDDIDGDSISVRLMTTGGLEVEAMTFAAVETNDTFETRTLTFDTGADATYNGSAIRIQFFDSNGGGTSTQSAIDNISLSVVPEPSAALLGGLGVLLLLRRRRCE